MRLRLDPYGRRVVGAIVLTGLLDYMFPTQSTSLFYVFVPLTGLLIVHDIRYRVGRFCPWNHNQPGPA